MRDDKRVLKKLRAAAVLLAGLTAAGTADAASSPQVSQFALQNGMQVVVIPDHRAAVVTQMLWFKVGAVDDVPGVSGLAHFFEHMMFRGTKLVPGDEYSQTIAKNGGEENAFTTHDYTAFFEQIAADRLKLAMDLEADRMVNLDLSDNNVATERDVVMEERRMRIDNNPQALLGEQMEAALHLSHPYGRPVIGWADEIRRIDKASAQDFYKHHYAPNNATLIVAGDVTPAQVRDLAQSEYGKVPARELQPRAEFTEPPRLAETRMTVVRPDAKVPIFQRLYRVPSYAQARPGLAEGLETLAQVMGGDETAALYRILVEDKKLASDAGCSYEGYARDAGEFTVYAVPRPGVSLETLEKAVDQVIAAFTAAPPNAQDLARAKTQLVASVIYRRDSQMALATAYGQALMIGLTVDDVNAWPDRIRAVTPQDVHNAASSLQRRDAVTAYLEPRGGKMMRRLLLILALVFTGLTPALAADIKPIDLGKGSDVWFAEDHTVPMVAMVFSFPAGSAYDPAGKAGMSAFAAALIDEGAGNLNANAFHQALANRAIQFSANIERDHMVVQLVSLSENLPEAMRLLQLALTHPRFDTEAVTRIRTQMIQGIQQNEAEPPDVARKEFMRDFFNGHAYGHDPAGEIASLAAITPDDLHAFARTHWVKGGLQIAVAGDITAPVVTKLLADTLRPVSGATPPPPPPIGKLGQPGTHVIPMAVPQPTILFGLPGIMRADPDFLPGYIANYIVGGGGFSSRLTTEVRVKRGLTYGITTGLNNFHRASVMLGSVATRADAVHQTIQVVHDTLADFAKNGPTEAELDDAKTFLTGSFPIAFASNAGTAAQLSTFQRQGLDIGYVAKRNALVQAVTLDDVRRVAKRLFDPTRLTVVVAGTPVEGKPVAPVPQAPVRPTPPPVVTPPAPPPANAATSATPAAKPAPKPVGVKPVVKPRP